MLVLLALLQRPLAPLFDRPAFQTWSTIFVSITVQAIPFLVLGVLISAAIAAWVSPAALRRVLPSRDGLAVPVAGLAGAALPGCECGSVPVAGRLVARDVPPAAAVTFLLSAPAINPVVIVATLVAFPGQPEMALARFVASLLAAVVVGWIWLRRGDDSWTDKARRAIGHDDDPPLERFRATAAHDLLHAGGYLVVGAFVAATLQVVVGRSALDAVADHGLLAVVALAVLAVVLCMCSEADAFVAASFTQFSPTSQLAFLVVGPMVDLKLVALQVGFFGRSFAARFAPLTFTVAVASSVIVGTALL
ncbi:MAG: permease [Acidimicrobiales bacterium]|nr:permease [Acidimicrobiales bacterium]